MLKYDGKDFAVGRAAFVSSLPGFEGQSAKIFVKIIPAALNTEVYALVDTGTPWLILDSEILGAIGLLGREGVPESLRTAAFGTMKGYLERTTITLVAEEGKSVELDATVFVCDKWPSGMNFIGYTGVLERIRFAVDSGTNSFFFGPAD